MKEDFIRIDQYDYIEHALEVAIAESISGRTHESGFLIITKIDRMNDKILTF